MKYLEKNVYNKKLVNEILEFQDLINEEVILDNVSELRICKFDKNEMS
jgi:hypothetical protein